MPPAPRCNVYKDTMSFPPSELNDIDRLLHLYACNNSLEEDVIRFWQEGLSNYCIQNQKLSFTLEQAEAAFTLHGVFPSSLKTVLNVLHKNKVIITPSDGSDDGILSTLLSLLSFSSSGLEGKPLIHTKVLDKVIDCISQHVNSKTELDLILSAQGDGEHSLHAFLSEAGDILEKLSTDDINILLKQLVANGRARISEDKSVLQLLPVPLSSSVSSSKATIITSISSNIPLHLLSIHQLRQSSMNIQSQINKLEEKIAQCKIQAFAAKVSPSSMSIHLFDAQTLMCNIIED
jgi:hypothetical protein